MARLPNLVEARVERVATLEVTMQVSKVLKGSAHRGSIVVADSMCYASLYTDLMVPGHTYVLPLSDPFNDPDPPRPGYAHSGPQDGQYQMAGCAESGFELVDGVLYAFEQTSGAQRKLSRYADYASFQRWYPVLDRASVTWILMGASFAAASRYLGPTLSLLWLALAVTAAGLFLRLGVEQRRRMLAFVATLPLTSLMIGVWGGLFRDSTLSADRDYLEFSWQVIPPGLGLLFFFSFAILYIRRNQTGRAFGVGYALANTPVVVAIAVMAILAINGKLF